MTQNVNNPDVKPIGPGKTAWKMFLRNKAATAGLIILTMVLLISILGPSLYEVDAYSMVAAPFTPPGTDTNVILGTDFLGRDIAAGLIVGGRATLLVGGAAALITENGSAKVSHGSGVIISLRAT